MYFQEEDIHRLRIEMVKNCIDYFSKEELLEVMSYLKLKRFKDITEIETRIFELIPVHTHDGVTSKLNIVKIIKDEFKMGLKEAKDECDKVFEFLKNPLNETKSHSEP